jgi:hypothetical protein
LGPHGRAGKCSWGSLIGGREVCDASVGILASGNCTTPSVPCFRGVLAWVWLNLGCRSKWGLARLGLCVPSETASLSKVRRWCVHFASSVPWRPDVFPLFFFFLFLLLFQNSNRPKVCMNFLIVATGRNGCRPRCRHSSHHRRTRAEHAVVGGCCG